MRQTSFFIILVVTFLVFLASSSFMVYDLLYGSPSGNSTGKTPPVLAERDDGNFSSGGGNSIDGSVEEDSDGQTGDLSDIESISEDKSGTSTGGDGGGGSGGGGDSGGNGVTEECVLCSGVELLNQGSPIDSGEEVNSQYTSFGKSAEASLYSIQHKNKLVYFFQTRGNENIVGRLNLDSKAWEIFTEEGWSAENDSIPRPLSETLFSFHRVKVYPNSRNDSELFILGSSGLMNGRSYLDIHSNIHNFIFNGNDFLHLIRNNTYSRYSATPISYSWTGSGIDEWSYDQNSDFGILVTHRGGYGLNDFSAVKYNLSSGNWNLWKNNSWGEYNWGSVSQNSFAIPINRSNSETFYNPSISRIDGTSDFLVVYRAYNGSHFSRAAKYSSSLNKWLVWNDGWSNSPSQQSMLLNYSLYEKQMISRGNKVYIFFSNYSGFYVGIYDDSVPSWRFNKILGNMTANYFVKLGPNNKIWLIYGDGAGLNYSIESNEEWKEQRLLYPGQNLSIIRMEFIENKPLFFIMDLIKSENRIFALADKTLGLQGAKREASRVPEPNQIDSEEASIVDSFDTEISSEIWNGTAYCNLSNEYGSAKIAHFEIDSENNLYAPRVSISSIGIFSEDYLSSSKGYNWGGFWDYISFPSSISVDNLRNKTFITDLIVSGGGGSLGSGRVQVWDKSRNNETTAWNVQSYCKPEIQQKTYFPAAIGGFNYPSDSAIDETNGYLYVTDSLNNRIQKFNLSNFVDGKPVKIGDIGIEGNGSMQFRFPQGIDTDSKGNVYVVDSYNHRIQKFDKNAVFIVQWGGIGREQGKFVYPYAISVDKITDLVYVSDPHNKRVQIFDSEGRYLYSFGKFSYGSGYYYSFSDYLGGLVAKNNTLYLSRSYKIFKIAINLSLDSPGIIRDSGEEKDPAIKRIFYFFIDFFRLDSNGKMITGNFLGIRPGNQTYY